MNDTVKNIKSINVNEFVDKSTVLKNLGKPLFNVKGVAYDSFEHRNKFGLQVGFKGDFVAIDLTTGEVKTSDAAFLPKSFTEQLRVKLMNSDASAVAFEVDISALASTVSTQGYAWIATPPRTEAMDRAREALINEAKQRAQKLIAAPVKNAKVKAA